MGKALGRHPDKALNAVRVRQVSQPGRYADGNGLYLVVDDSGAKRWLLRTVVQGRRRDIGLGGVSLVSLAEAREKALTYRKVAREGGDPLAEKQKTGVAIPTFAQAAKLVYEEQRGTWRNAKHAQQWINTLTQYALPLIGNRRIDQIDTPDVLRVLAPIWLTKAETARRVRQRIGTVMDWAKASGYRTGDNPVDGVTKGLPKQTDPDQHHVALPYPKVPSFVARLQKSGDGEIARLAFEFLILTASRTSEVLHAQWSEIGLEEKIWTIPASRMKAKKVHRVPMSDRCVTLLHRARELSENSRWLFPSRSVATPLSNTVFLMMLRRMSVTATGHGFRSSFRDWAAEATSYPRELAEMALAHTIENKVEAAYRRGDLLEKRREMMDDWSLFVINQA